MSPMNPPDLAAALADCLARIEAGASPATVLADYPSLAADLAPMIAAATAVTQLQPALPRPAYRARLAGELAELEARLAAERVAAPAGSRFGSAALIVAALVLLGGVVVVGTRSQGAGRPTAGTTNDAAPASAVEVRADRPTAPSPIARQRPPTTGAHRSGLALAAGRDHGGAAARPTAAALRPRAKPLTGAGRAALALPALPSPTPTLTPSAEPTLPGEPTESPSAAPRHTSTPPPVSPSPTAESTATVTAMADGQLGGRVLLGNSPLASVTVGIFLIPYGADCVPAAGAEPLLATQTDASGAFQLTVPSGEARYQLAAWGGDGRHCFPRRWHTGPSNLALANPCDVAVGRFSVPPGFDVRSMDIRFADSDTTPCGG